MAQYKFGAFLFDKICLSLLAKERTNCYFPVSSEILITHYFDSPFPAKVNKKKLLILEFYIDPLK